MKQIRKESALRKSLIKSEKQIYLYIGILCALGFIAIYGINVLNPTYVDWLMSGGDLTQHYLGWRAYRAGNWCFPIGLTDQLSYPYKTSVIFTDSIPLLAVIFKLLSPVLPRNFQYFGLWGILCFILQGIMTARILRHFTKDPLVLILISVLFSFTPVLIFRMFVHTSLAGHWLLLLVLEPLFYYDSFKENRRILLTSLLAGALSASIHTYLVLMCGIILMGICVEEVMYNRKITKALSSLFIFVSSSAIVTWLLGGFSSQVGPASGGLGYFSANLNALVNPQDWSVIFKTLPLYETDIGTGQYEGFAYLGAGWILLLILALFFYIDRYNLKAPFGKYRSYIIPVLAVFLCAFIFALSPTVTLNEKVIIYLHFPHFITDIWSVFRSSGRIIWVNVYITMLIVAILLLKSADKRMIYISLLSILILQIYDIKDELADRRHTFSKKNVYESNIDENTFNIIGKNKSIKHLVWAKSCEEYGIMNPLTVWALDHGLTANDFYFARSLDESSTNAYRQQVIEQPSEENLIIFPTYDKVLLGKYDLHYYFVDDVIVGYKNTIDGINELNDTDFYNVWNFGDNEYLKPEYGCDTDDGRIIYPEGASYGPNWHIPAGNYEIGISGESMPEELEVSVYSGEGAVFYEHSTIQRDSENIRISVSFTKEITDLGIALNNHSDRDVLIKSIELRYTGDPAQQTDG